MIELVMHVCLLSATDKCRDEVLTFAAEAVSARECQFNGQLAMAQWAGEHPGYRIRKWTCRPAGQVTKI